MTEAYNKMLQCEIIGVYLTSAKEAFDKEDDLMAFYHLKRVRDLTVELIDVLDKELA